MAVGSVLTNISAGNVLTKTAGVIGLGLVAYDSHNAGKLRSEDNPKEHKAKSLADAYLDDMSMSSPSVVRQNVKEGLFRYKTDENITSFYHAITGYFKGFGSMLVHNAIPFALAAGTFVGSKGASGTFSKCCGVGLAVYGGCFLLKEFFGIGKE